MWAKQTEKNLTTTTATVTARPWECTHGGHELYLFSKLKRTLFTLLHYYSTSCHVTVYKRRIAWPASSSIGTRNHRINTVMVMKTADETPYPASSTSSRVAWLIKLPAFTTNRRSKCKIAPTIFSIMRAVPKLISDTIRAANTSRIFKTSRISPKNTWSTVYIPSPV